MLQAAKAEVDRLKQEAEEDRKDHQEALKEMDEMLDDFARALGLPERIPVSDYEAPGYPHILEAIEALHADLAPFVALAEAAKFYLEAQEQRRKYIESLKGKELENQVYLKRTLDRRQNLADTLAHPAVQRAVKEMP